MIKQKNCIRSIAQSSRFIGLFYFVIVGCFTAVYAENRNNLSQEVPLLETTQFELLGTNHGRLHLNIKAYEMRQYANGNITFTGGIEIIMFEPKLDKDPNSTRIEANSLSYDKEQGLCVLTGSVLLSKPDKGLKINTEQLCYDITQEVIFTESPVVIVHKEHLLRGSLLRASKDLTKYTISGPSGRVDAKKEALLGSNTL